MSDKSNKYGYVGVDIPAQSFGANKGVFNPAEINELVADNKWTQYGQLELIETKTGSGVSSIDFTTLYESTYNVHFLTINDYQVATDGQDMVIRLSDDGGSTYESSNYDWAHQVGQANGTFAEYRSTTASSLEINRFNGNQTNEKANAYVYLYNLGDNTKYSFSTSQATATLEYTERYGMQFGSGVYHIASSINAFRLQCTTSGNISVTSASLYGIKEYS